MQNTATLKIEAPINDPDGMTTSNRAHFIRGHFSNAAVLFEHIRRGMPPTVLGPLSGEDTLSAVAFLHIRNGLPADSAALQGSDLAGLVLPGADPIASDFPGAPETPQAVTPGSGRAGPVVRR